MSSVQAALSRIAGLQARLHQLAPPAGRDFGAVLDRALAAGPGVSSLQSTGPASIGSFWSGGTMPATPIRFVDRSTVRATTPDASWRRRVPERATPYLDAIEQAARDAGIDPRMLAAVAWAESTFVPDAVSATGAIGLTQLMPATAAALGVDPYDPAANLAGGARYLREQLDRFGTAELMLAAYNAGPGRVERSGGVPDIDETRAYVPRVLGYYRQLGGTA